MQVAERRGLALALAQAIAHALHQAGQAAAVVERLGEVDLLRRDVRVDVGRLAVGMLTAQLVDRAAIGGLDEEARMVLDLLAAHELLVEAVPGLVVEGVEVGVVEADPLPRQARPHRGDRRPAELLVLALHDPLGLRLRPVAQERCHLRASR